MRMGETKQIQFRAEMFNIFNHPNFDLPVNVIDSIGTAGEIQFANKPPHPERLLALS